MAYSAYNQTQQIDYSKRMNSYCFCGNQIYLQVALLLAPHGFSFLWPISRTFLTGLLSMSLRPAKRAAWRSRLNFPPRKRLSRGLNWLCNYCTKRQFQGSNRFTSPSPSERVCVQGPNLLPKRDCVQGGKRYTGGRRFCLKWHRAFAETRKHT